MIIMNENFTRCKSDELKANANISLVEKKSEFLASYLGTSTSVDRRKLSYFLVSNF